MRLDEDIKRDVERGLAASPHLDPTDVGVTVKDGVVTLTGFVATYAEAHRAEDVAKAVPGVAGVANAIEVRPPDSGQPADPRLARAAAAALRSAFPEGEPLAVSVDRGQVTIAGEVAWPDQRRLAEAAVRALPGVKEVTNLVRVRGRERLTAEDVLSGLAATVLTGAIVSMVYLTLR